MAPFPWHFGGQRYQNLFIHSAEIVHWFEKLGLRMCLDVSHRSLICTYFNTDIYGFVAKIAPLTAYIQMRDARGINRQGLQIGDGNLDFDRLAATLKKGCADAGFIPGIW